MLFKKKTFFLTLLILILLIAGCRIPGCGSEEENSGENTQNEIEMPEEVEEIESALLEIMHEADLIPLVTLVSQQSGEGAESGNQQSDEQENQESEGEEGQEVEITFEKTILGEVLQRELDEENDGGENNQLPTNTEEIWDNIKTNITEVHYQWNELEPKLIQENMYTDTINSFEESLEGLTLFSSEQNHFGTLTEANELTNYLSKFMVPFAENTISTVNELKYHTRNIVLSAAVDNYEEAQESLTYMKEQSLVVTRDLENYNVEDLDTALNNLQRALDTQDVGLIDIKAAIVMEELIQINDELE
ncbi:hypothetical protein [Candidatus Contubernalis alkaliaceticus]|uniref:hypothetical protein n=1 Tax=Candidatus Contubernalis alkaliaceticus TaxID=338645 RepID=UPI001F4C1352|nr:hypothetical protein [Candidatus Contubernalis alkalaceticus]UNC91942.1 hypothetical protein HUE98_07430 [Candidatus Contubernalis alkalaceticus]